MKITCNSCGSKYTIADAKVQGKKVKVRCKGCKESILVDGTKPFPSDDSEDSDGEAPESLSAPAMSPFDSTENEAPKVPPAPRVGVWSVNISDDDSRDMTIEELVQAWKNGVVSSDAYVWRDGMSDWKPILEVGELKHKLGSLSNRGIVSSASSKAVKPTPSGVGDLFGSPARAGAETKSGGGLGEAKPTGARNDSSVLFSLDSITNPNDSGSKARANVDVLFGGMSPSVGMLGNNPDLLTAPAKDPPPAPVGVRSASPGVQSAPAKGKGGLIAAILGAAVIIGGAVFYMGSSGDKVSTEVDEKLAAAQAKTEEALKKAEEAQKKAEADRMKLEEDLKKAREGAEGKAEDPAAAEAKKKSDAEKPTPKEEGSPATSGSSSTSGSPPSDSSAPVKPAQAAGPGPFNVAAAKSALSSAAANAASCKKPDGPTGGGKVQVTFSPSGRVTSAQVVSGPFGGTSVGGCVASTFRRARVPAFSGESKTVTKSFSIQ
jgi:predicted Zn finger-like uncharacterized protein